jgi:hypothetical protein
MRASPQELANTIAPLSEALKQMLKRYVKYKYGHAAQPRLFATMPTQGPLMKQRSLSAPVGLPEAPQRGPPQEPADILQTAGSNASYLSASSTIMPGDLLLGSTLATPEVSPPDPPPLPPPAGPPAGTPSRSRTPAVPARRASDPATGRTSTTGPGSRLGDPLQGSRFGGEALLEAKDRAHVPRDMPGGHAPSPTGHARAGGEERSQPGQTIVGDWRGRGEGPSRGMHGGDRHQGSAQLAATPEVGGDPVHRGPDPGPGGPGGGLHRSSAEEGAATMSEPEGSLASEADCVAPPEDDRTVLRLRGGAATPDRCGPPEGGGTVLRLRGGAATPDRGSPPPGSQLLNDVFRPAWLSGEASLPVHAVPLLNGWRTSPFGIRFVLPHFCCMKS